VAFSGRLSKMIALQIGKSCSIDITKRTKLCADNYRFSTYMAGKIKLGMCYGTIVLAFKFEYYTSQVPSL
jgi:hypothetical protein